MAKEKNSKIAAPVLKYRRVEVTALDKGRRGKHHDLVEGILEELRMAAPGSALEIPLADVGGIGLANLRSAVHRASTSAGIAIETLADEKNFYVWKKKNIATQE
jgi:hypothetical protein